MNSRANATRRPIDIPTISDDAISVVCQFTPTACLMLPVRSKIINRLKTRMNTALKIGYLELVKYCNVRVINYHHSFEIIAALHGHLHILKWFKTQYNSGCSRWDEECFANAVLYGDIKILKWLFSNNCPIGASAFDNAAETGNLKILKWLKARECPIGPYTFVHACEYGDLEILDWMYFTSFPYHETAPLHAARDGNLEVLKWLKRRKYFMGRLTMEYAIKNVDFSIIEWLKDTGVELNIWCCYYAIVKNDLELLKWLRLPEVNCPWDWTLMYETAATLRHGEICEWLWIAMHPQVAEIPDVLSTRI